MSPITFSVGGKHPLDTSQVSLVEQPSTVGLTLSPGRNTFESGPLSLGTIRIEDERALEARLRFVYHYDEANRTITLCASDYPSRDGLALVLPRAERPELVFFGAGGDIRTDEPALVGDAELGAISALGVDDVFRSIAREASRDLIFALQRTPDLIVQLRTRMPEMAPADLQALQVVYRDGYFRSPYEPGMTLSDKDRVLSVESVFGGTVTFNYMEYFANVIGSTSDPKIASLSWIRLWANQFGIYPQICTSYNFGGFACGTDLVGGHIITGTKASYMPKGSNSVYILPICKSHNNNDNVYMAALQYFQGIWLHNYLGK